MNAPNNHATSHVHRARHHHCKPLISVLAALVSNLLLDGTAEPSAATLSFGPPVAYDTAGANTDLQIADMNQDGKLDLVASVINQFGDGSVSVLPGRGDGTFDQAMLRRVGHQVASLAVADINRDGRQDVATGDYISTLSVLLGRGNGRFRAPVDYETGPGPAYVAIGDVNRDGRPDLISTSPAPTNPGADNSVSVLIGRGDGTFQPHIDYPTGWANGGVTIADINRDGKPDAVTSRSLLLGRGDGSFQPYTDYAPGNFADTVAVGDLNRDGKPDLALTRVETDPGSLGILLGRGNGTFREPRDYVVTGQPGRLTIGDVNGDGRPDLINTYRVVDPSHPGGGITVLLGRRNGAFQPPQDFGPISGGGVIQVADLNRDGKFDLIAATGFRVYVLLNDGP